VEAEAGGGGGCSELTADPPRRSARPARGLDKPGDLLVEGERIAAVGKLDFVREYGAETGSQTPFLSVWYAHSGLAGPDRATRAKNTRFWGEEATSG
jgi:hypothetical protein